MVRGLKVLKDVAAKGFVMEIPFSRFITADSVLSHFFPALHADILAAEASAPSSTSNSIISRLTGNAMAVSILFSCEIVLALFLCAARFYSDRNVPLSLPDGIRAFVDMLPELREMGTPEMWFLLEYRDVPSEYIASDDFAAGEREKRSAAGGLYDAATMQALLGTRARWTKLTRRVEKLFQRFSLLKQHCQQPSEVASSPVLDMIASMTFVQWLWSLHMVSSRTFMYRRPKGSSYPIRFVSGYDNGDDDEREDEESEDGDDEAAVLEAVESAKQAHKTRLKNEAAVREQRLSVDASHQLIMDRALAVAGDEGSRRSQRIGAAAIETLDDNNDTDSDTDDESDSGSSGSRGDDANDPELLAMIPVADMMNHDPQFGTQDFSFDKSTGALQVRATLPLAVGDEVCLRYNAMDHWRFAKYYGFVPGTVPGITSSSEKGALRKGPGGGWIAGMADAFPVAPPPPPTVTLPMSELRREVSSEPLHEALRRHNAASILAITKAQLFEGKALKQHCYVTSSGPNQQLRSVLRLAFLGPAELSNYVSAYEVEPLSIRNEWHCYDFLKRELELRRVELERSSKRVHVPSAGLSVRGSTILAVRERDMEVVGAALESCRSRLDDLSNLLHFSGATTMQQQLTRRNVVLQQFRQLKAKGHVASATQAAHTAPVLHPSPLTYVAPLGDLDSLYTALLAKRNRTNAAVHVDVAEKDQQPTGNENRPL